MLISRAAYRHAFCAPSKTNPYSSANGSRSVNNIKLNPIEQKEKHKSKDWGETNKDTHTKMFYRL